MISGLGVAAGNQEMHGRRESPSEICGVRRLPISAEIVFGVQGFSHECLQCAA